MTLHGIRIQLTHVAPSVLLFHRFYVQVPRELVRVTDRDPWIVCDDMLVDGLDGLRVRLDPTDLRQWWMN